MTTQPGTDLAIIIVEGYLLTHADRCDQCGARAYVHTILKTDGELYWCRHHFNQHRAMLLPKCLYINDETKQLFEGIKDDHWVEGKPVSLPPRKTFG